jgi:hypothetical protein
MDACHTWHKEQTTEERITTCKGDHADFCKLWHDCDLALLAIGLLVIENKATSNVQSAVLSTMIEELAGALHDYPHHPNKQIQASSCQQVNPRNKISNAR